MLRSSDIDLMLTPVSGVTPGIEQVYAYLQKRGIRREDVDPLGLRVYPARELIQAARGGSPNLADTRLAVVFPHHDVGGRPIDWWSSRLIEAGLKPVTTGFQAMVDIKWGKMFCPPNEPPHAYLVPTLDWSRLTRGARVYIHESCIKAINGARLGRWSVGLNGVWGWCSRKHDIALVEELKGLPWKALELEPVIVFDSNAEDNWEVQHAIRSLAARIHAITGRLARHVLCPRTREGNHQGFDDYCMEVGDETAVAFLDAEGELVEISDVGILKSRLNSEVCVVRSLGRVAEQETGTIMSRQTFTDVNYATYVADVDDKIVNIPRLWLIDERRTEVERLEYSPGAERIRAGEFLNLWRGMGVSPVAGDVKPWLDLLAHCIPEEGLRRWLVQWMAYPLQNLGAKMTPFVHLYGPPGSGKNAVLAPVMAIYGPNGVVIGKDQIASSFNSVYAAKQFVNIDEIHGGNEQGALAITNRIKLICTADKLVVNRKGDPEYTIRNHINLVTTSNYSDSIKLDEGDRRACVIQFGSRESPLGAGFWDGYWSWSGGGGAEALYEHLLGISMDGFDPAAAAPMTEWKEDVTDATRGAMEKWVRDLWEDPDSVLPPIMHGFKVLTAEQLGAAYYPGEPGKNTPGLRNQLGLRMKDMGFKRTDQVKVDGTPRRFWIVRDRDVTWGNKDLQTQWAKQGKLKY